MILLKSNGVNCGMEGEENLPRDIRLRNDWEHGNMIHMHIQHPNAVVLGDPIEFDATQARELANVLNRLADAYEHEHKDNSDPYGIIEERKKNP